MQNTDIYALPYLEAGDLVEDIAGQSKKFVEGVEAVMLTSDFRGQPGEPGPPGEPGLPGVNAVPADEAVAAYLNATDTATRTAAGALFGDDATAALVSDENTATGAAVRSLVSSGGTTDDGSVADLVVNPATETGLAVRQAIGDSTRPLAEAVGGGTWADGQIDRVRLVSRFPIRENGEVSWMQGFAINPAANELYVSNQKDTELRIDVRNLATGERISSKLFTTGSGAFSESLNYWYNTAGDLCFMVFPQGGGANPSKYAILNYTKATLGPAISIYGFSRMSRQGNTLVSSDLWTFHATKFYYYDWESIKAGTPNLLGTVVVRDGGTLPGKSQGLAWVGESLIVSQGSQTEAPTLTVYNTRGDITTVRQYSRPAFRYALNALRPGTMEGTGSYFYECEGAAAQDGKLYTAHVIDDQRPGSPGSYVYILEHGAADGVKIEANPFVAGWTGNEGWQQVTLLSGWEHVAGQELMVRWRGGKLQFKGYCRNATFTGGYTDAGTLPTNLPKLAVDRGFSIPSNTTAVRAGLVKTTGALQFYSSAATSAWYGADAFTY